MQTGLSYFKASWNALKGREYKIDIDLYQMQAVLIVDNYQN